MTTPPPLVNLLDYEQAARTRLSKMAYDYFAGGANDEVTLRENRAVFERLGLRPRMLRDVSQRDTSVMVLGQRHPLPFLIAPMGFLGLAHPESERALVRAAGRAGVGMILSTMSSSSLEEVAEANTYAAPLWFQLYIYKDREITRNLVQRAEAAGYQALVLTVDTPILGRREQDIRNGWHLPPDVQVKNLLGYGLEKIGGVAGGSGLAAYIASLWDSAIAWRDVAWLRSITRLPVLVKGILRSDDALQAVEAGVAGLIVSNHGGRQVDTTPSALEVLPEIVDAVDGRVEILMDGGIRRGTDLIKALALGAKAALVGRPLIWGLAQDGEAGAYAIMDILRTEFDLSLALCGCHNVAELSPDILHWRRA
jgi:4-hydroxymandelate oxidase